MLELAFSGLAFAVGYYLAKAQLKIEKHDKNRFCVYKRTDGGVRLAQLAQDMKLGDELAIIKLVAVGDEHVPFKTPFCIDSDRIRFYTNNGEAINTVNWKELANGAVE